MQTFTLMRPPEETRVSGSKEKRSSPFEVTRGRDSNSPTITLARDSGARPEEGLIAFGPKILTQVAVTAIRENYDDDAATNLLGNAQGRDHGGRGGDSYQQA